MQAAASTTNSKWTEIGHYYEPIAFYGNKVLKYAGIACEMNRDNMMAKPGMVMLDTYKGDRITADNHELFTAI